MAREPKRAEADETYQALGLLREPPGLNERLLNALLSISGCATLEDALEPLLDAALDVTKMDGGGVYWVEGDVAVLRHHRGLPEAFIREVTRMSLTPPPVQTLLQLREPVEVGAISTRMRELFRKHGIQHAFSFPLRARGILFGFLNVGSTRAESPAKAGIQALWVLVKQIEALFFRLYSEKALRRSEQLLKRSQEIAHLGSWELDLATGELTWSDEVYRIFGLKPPEFGGTYEAFLACVHPDDRQAVDKTYTGSIREGRDTYEIEHRIVRRDTGEVRIVHEKGEHFRTADGRIVRSTGMVHDITERQRGEEALRESEERFHAFMDNSPAIAWMRDEQGRYVYLSRTYTRHSGKSLEECRGKTAFDLWPREIAEGFQKIDQEVLRTGRPLEAMEEVPTPEGRRSYWWNVKFPFQDAAGRRFVGGIGVDITERKQAEALLQQANERLEGQVQTRTRELNLTIDRLQRAMEELTHRAGQLQKITLELSQAEDRERRRLAQFLHDDLQQVLAAAKFHLSVLAGRIESQPAALEILAQIRNMLKDAIEKSRSLSHELGPPILYGGVLDAVFEWLAGQMERKHGLTVRVEVRRHANSRSEPVRSFLYRAAQEILFNTAKHAQVRAARLRLQRVRQELWLTISDRGCGFDPASLAQTAGFGLLTIRERAELLGGRMTIKSAPGKGSIFFITVPDVGA